MGLYDYKNYIANEEACRELLSDIRWPDGIKCPKYKTKSYHLFVKNQPFTLLK
jgi:hypothetical protein